MNQRLTVADRSDRWALTHPRVRGAMLVGLLLCASTVFAGPHGPHPDVVAQAKADLQAAGVDLSGDCGAFQIVKLTAWRLKAEGAGLLDKPSGAGCQGYSKDVIAYGDGQIYDILVASGDPGGNGPVWNDDGTVDPSRWRAPIDPGPVGPAPVPSPTPAPAPAPSPTPVDLTPILTRLDHLDAQQADVEAEYLQLAQLVSALQQLANDTSARVSTLEAKPVPMSCSASVWGVPIHCALR